MCARTAGILPVFLLSAALAAGETQTVPLFAPADDGIRQGFARVVNLSDRAGTVSVRARDDAGALRRTSFDIAASAVRHFNSDDLERGNAAKGMAGVGDGTGDWHLALDSDLPIAVSAYLRTDDGFLAAMNAVVDRGPDGVHRVMTFNPASNADRESQLRLVNQSGRATTATVRGVDDRGAPGASPATVALPPNGARTLSARELEDMGLGDGAGKWRLLITAPEPIAVMSLMSTTVGYLTNLSSAPEGTTISLFTAAAESRQSFVRIVNRSAVAGTVRVVAIDDSGTVHGAEVDGEGRFFTLPIGGHQVLHFNSDDLERGNAAKGIAGVGSGAGHWRLSFFSSLDVQVLAYMRTEDGFLTALHDVVGEAEARSGGSQRGRGEQQVPLLNPGSNARQESVLRIVNTSYSTTSVVIRGHDDAGREGGRAVRIALRRGEALMLTAQQLEDMGLGDGAGKWRLSVTATNPVVLMSLMRTRTGHLTNLSYLPDTVRVIAAPLVARFAYEEDDGIPFGIRFDATASSGDIVDYAWDFGEDSEWVPDTPGTGPTPLFVYDSTWFFAGTRGPRLGYEGRYPATATYPVTLTVTDRHGATAAHARRIVVTNTLSFAGMRDLIGRVTDSGGHRGKLIISELGVGEAFEGSHAQQTVYVSMKEQGVPKANILAHGPGIANRRATGLYGLLTHPDNAALRAETLVVNLSILPAFGALDAEHIPAHNIISVAAAGNLTTRVRACAPTDPRIRDFWRSDHPYFSCGNDRSGIYTSTMDAVRTGKALMATAAVRNEDGTVVPDTDVMMCGDTKEQCFAVEQSGVTSASAAQLSAAVFHLFQTYEDAEDVIRALKSCATDIGEPGVDREFGHGLVDFRCAEAMLPVVEQ